MKILKFGGSSVGDPERIKNTISIVLEANEKNDRIAVVFSAFQGMTDLLIKIGALASADNIEYRKYLHYFKENHINAVRGLICADRQKEILDRLNTHFSELENILLGVQLIKELSPKSSDYVQSFGERLSCFIISEAVKEKLPSTELLDSRLLIKTDNSFGAGRVNVDITYENIRSYFAGHTALQVITGFIASTLNNETITLGRGGSDYTAAIFGAALECEEIEIWTDVDGVMTADPRKVKRAFSISEMTWHEAMEMSHFGAKVIHPPTMTPAMDKCIPIRIKNTFNPSFPGTVISGRNSNQLSTVKGITSIGPISLLQIEGMGGVNPAKVGSRIFSSLAEKKINVLLLTMASSEHSLCIAVLPTEAAEAKQLLEKELRLEILEKQISEITVASNLSIVSVVGENMKNTPGVSGKLFQALGKNGINAVAISQGASELNISTVINSEDEAKALNALHDAFFLSNYKSLNLFIIGTGLIGRTLFKQIQNQREVLANELFIDVRIVALANSRKMLFDTHGFSVDDWENRFEKSTEKMDLDAFVRRMKELNLPNSIFVDCTSSEQILPKYLEILGSSISIVTPNKKANSSSYDFYLELKHAALKYNVKFLYETNVGAGLPVISTLHDLVTSGDKIIRIQGILSGTLSYIFNTFDGNASFSSVVKEAREKGYTEPDPREDLNGLDVARKLIILVREAGIKLEFDDIRVENLIPESARSASSIDEFFVQLEKSDAEFEAKRAAAAAEGKVLRYIATYENGNASISLQAVDKTHPFYSLQANDNIIAFKTVYYNERPVVIQGPGAGAEVTSGGVFADIVRISNYLI
ncbi:MAG: bifunctional aspartate kinase/homoserine dehydrogenase I [Bacteroidota bacterium]